jgi:hypothetical protein
MNYSVYVHIIQPNTALRYLTLLLCIREVPGSILPLKPGHAKVHPLYETQHVIRCAEKRYGRKALCK